MRLSLSSHLTHHLYLSRISLCRTFLLEHGIFYRDDTLLLPNSTRLISRNLSPQTDTTTFLVTGYCSECSLPLRRGVSRKIHGRLKFRSRAWRSCGIQSASKGLVSCFSPAYEECCLRINKTLVAHPGLFTANNRAYFTPQCLHRRQRLSPPTLRGIICGTLPTSLSSSLELWASHRVSRIKH